MMGNGIFLAFFVRGAAAFFFLMVYFTVRQKYAQKSAFLRAARRLAFIYAFCAFFVSRLFSHCFPFLWFSLFVFGWHFLFLFLVFCSLLSLAFLFFAFVLLFPFLCFSLLCFSFVGFLSLLCYSCILVFYIYII